MPLTLTHTLKKKELHFPAWKVTYVQPHLRYDYVLKYDPNIAKRKEWKTVVPKLYHNYPDIFVKTDFDKLPERRPGDHAIELTADFKPICTKHYQLSQPKSFIR